MKTTIAEKRKILGTGPARHTSARVEFITTGLHHGWQSQTVHVPDETRVEETYSSAATALREHRHGVSVYVAPAGRYHRGDVLAIHDGRDLCVELGLGPSGGCPDLVPLSGFVAGSTTPDDLSFRRAWRGGEVRSHKPEGCVAVQILRALGLSAIYERECRLDDSRQRSADLDQYVVYRCDLPAQPRWVVITPSQLTAPSPVLPDDTARAWYWRRTVEGCEVRDWGSQVEAQAALDRAREIVHQEIATRSASE